MFWFFAAIAIVWLLFNLIKTNFSQWKKRNVSEHGPWKNFKRFIQGTSQSKPFTELIRDIYTDFPNEGYSGFYEAFSPAIMLKDPELIKQMVVKDFDHFTDRRSFLTAESDPYWSRNLVALRGEKWRKMRATLSPSFTSSKMKTMFVLISECAEGFIKHFQKKNEDVVTVEFADIFSRYTNDVIATSAYGVRCDSVENRENQFYVMGKNASNFSGFWKSLSFTLAIISPKLGQLLKVKIFDENVGNFFYNLINDTIKTREEKNIVRPDMIHLLMEARKGKHHHENDKTHEESFASVEEHIKPEESPAELTVTDITAQALIFFLAGFETVSKSMCFTAYELGVNQEIQDKLREEVDETCKSCNGKVTYEAIMKMKYLDMVISESMRKWPNAPTTDRQCVKDYTIQPSNGDEQAVSLVKGDVVWIPIYALHRDERYYPEPERFDPERFSEESKSNINPYAYLPFGVGPRNCIGSRFALLEIKCLLYHLLSNFEIVPVEKTEIPIKLNKSFTLSAQNGFWMGLKARKQN